MHQTHLVGCYYQSTMNTATYNMQFTIDTPPNGPTKSSHPAGRRLSSDFFVNSVIIVVYENFSVVL